MGELSEAVKIYYDKLGNDLLDLYRESRWNSGVDVVRERVHRAKQDALMMAQTIEGLVLNVPTQQFMQYFLSLQITASQERVNEVYNTYRRMGWREIDDGIHKAEQRILEFGRKYQL